MKRTLTSPINYSWFRLLLLAAFLLPAISSFSQTTGLLKGRITDEQGIGLPGISVLIGKNGTQTNEVGAYTISLAKGGVQQVIFRGVGYKTIIKDVDFSAASTALDLKMVPDVLGLDEVVITGQNVGTTKKQLGNAVSSIRSAQLTKTATPNILGALQGKIAGAQITQNSGDPAGGFSIRLRGTSTFAGSSDPLYIVDGVIVSNATTNVTNRDANSYGGAGDLGQNRLIDLNPADIDRIEVIDGAAAAAQYGSRASNGVVQIFTKRGSSGKPVISFSTSFNINRLRKKIFANLTPLRFGDSVTRLVTLKPGLTKKVPITRYDYQDNIFATGYGNTQNINIAGGSEDTKYFISANYLYNQGIIKLTDFTRFGLNTRIDQRLTNWLTANIGLNFIHNKANEKPDGNSFFSPVNSINITDNIYNIDVKDAAGNYQAAEPTRVNPNTVIYDIKQSEEVNRVIGNLQLHATPFAGFSLDYVAGLDQFTQSGQTLIPVYPYPGVNSGYYNDGYASAANQSSYNLNQSLSAAFATNLAAKIRSNTQIGFDYQYTRSRFTDAQGRGLSPFAQTVQGTNLPVAGSPPSDQRSETILQGYYFQETLGFNNLLFLTGGVRVDGSSVFASSKRQNLYLKSSGSLVVSNFDFWKNASLSKVWNNFKIRASFGQAGNLTAIGPYDRFTNYGFTPYLGASSSNPSRIRGNEDINVERQTEREVGADLSFFNDRLGVELTAYSKSVKDLIVNQQLAPSSAYVSQLSNLARMTNKGIELLVRGTPVRSKDFKWDATVVFSQNENLVVNNGTTSSVVIQGDLNNVSGVPIALINGQPFGVYYGYFYARNPDGSLLLTAAGLAQRERGVQVDATHYTVQRDAAGQPLASGSLLQKVIGNPNPKYTASFTSDFTFKKLALHVLFDAVQGNDVFNADKRTRNGVGIGSLAEAELLGAFPRGYVSSIYPITEYRIDNASFFKLREVGLSYAFGDVIPGVKDLNFGVFGRNLYSWDHNFNGYDPEVNAAGNGNIGRGIIFGAVPIPRVFQFTLSAKF